MLRSAGSPDLRDAHSPNKVGARGKVGAGWRVPEPRFWNPGKIATSPANPPGGSRENSPGRKPRAKGPQTKSPGGTAEIRQFKSIPEDPPATRISLKTRKISSYRTLPKITPNPPTLKVNPRLERSVSMSEERAELSSAAFFVDPRDASNFFARTSTRSIIWRKRSSQFHRNCQQSGQAPMNIGLLVSR